MRDLQRQRARGQIAIDRQLTRPIIGQFDKALLRAGDKDILGRICGVADDLQFV